MQLVEEIKRISEADDDLLRPFRTKPGRTDSPDDGFDWTQDGGSAGGLD